jgi:phenylalanyl-tRNA synthetase beta chain
MKLTESWLREFVDLPDLAPEDLVENLEALGHEVEAWHVLEPSFSGVVVGRVLEVLPHPDADKVRVTTVDVGDETLEIICGAWNFSAGAVVPVALPGAVLGGDFTITRRTIRGIVSNGMICSETELDLGDEAAGIMVLNEDYPGSIAAIGQPFAGVVGLPDVWLEINVTPNRPDCLSVYGLARDLAAFHRVDLRHHRIAVTEAGEPSAMSVDITVPEMNPRFAGRQVRNITVGPSPHWLRRRLELAGVRPISNVVDASNYAMIEFGHPTHAFDVDRLGTTIVTRMAKPNEQVVTLDDQDRTLTTDDIVVTDGSRVVAIGGVMGGASTEVDDTTSDVFIEAAYWDPASVLMTSKRLGLRSEASARFERGADPSFCALAADRVAQLLQDIAGGSPAPGPVDVDPGHVTPWTVAYPLDETRRLLGVPLDGATTSELLERLGFGVAGTDPLMVEVPTRRPDVLRKADVVEEIARLHGFDGIPESVPRGPGGGLPFRERRLRKVREIMVGAGFHETMTFSFIGSADLDRLGYPDGHAVRAGIRVVNPLNEGEGVMRTTLLPGVLKAAATNLARRIPDAHLFEIGKAFLEGAGKLPEQPERLAFVIAGTPASTWLEPAREPDVYDGLGVWQLLADRAGVPDSSVRRGSLPSFHPGRCAEILVGDVVIGAIGEVHPNVVGAFGLDGRVVAGELDLAELLVDRGHWEFAAPSVYPPIIFDLAFSVDAGVPADDVIRSARDGAGPLLEDVHVFDVFRGASVGEGRTSIALSFRLRAPDRTLTDEEAAPIRKRIADVVAARTGAVLRGEL